MSSGPIDTLVYAPHHGHDALGTSQSFLQALTATNHNPKQENAAIYVHPLVKKSSAKLSEKSLEMCTESLGSETGSDDIMEDTMIVSSYSSIFHSKENKIISKTKRDYKFPPPLSSINDSVSMKSHRENGRLVMNAVLLMDSSNSSLFLAERINGRLTLQLKKGDLEEIVESEDEIDVGETEDSASWGEDQSENMEGNIGNEEYNSRVGKCSKTGEKRGRRGHNWNAETCWVAT